MSPTSSIISKGKKERNRSQKMILFFLLSLAARCQFWDLALSYLEAVISWMLMEDVDSWVRDKGLLQHSRRCEHEYILTSSP